MFNTRELAYVIWGTITLCFILRSKSSRIALAGILRLLFCKKLLYVYAISLIYAGLSVILLARLTAWDSSQVKDTVMWYFSVACPLMFKSARVKSFENFVKEIGKPLIAVSIFFEFALGLYTFDLWIELLMAPALILIVGISAFAGDKPEKAKLTKVMNALQLLIGIAGLAAIIWHLIMHYNDYLTRGVLMQFSIPLSLSLLFVPLLYGLAMFVHYEDALSVLKSHFKDKGVYYYAVFKIMLRFHGDLAGLGRWRHMVFTKNIQTGAEVDQAIILIKKLQKAEAEPHTVNEGLGWSPYRVKDLLISRRTEMTDYKNTFGKEFMSITMPVKVNGSGPLADTITYTILGEQLVATKLKLALKVYHGKEEHIASLQHLVDWANQLYLGLFGQPLPASIKTVILLEQDVSITMPFAKIIVKKEIWKNQTNGFQINLLIRHDNHQEL